MSKTKLFGVTGNPVLHSKSPTIFNSLFRAGSIDAVYTRISASSPEEALYLFNEVGFDGMNVTAPFKEDIIPFLDNVDGEAGSVGGVNVVVREGDKIIGYNTDVVGVVNSFKKNGVELKGAHCIVLGAGGAGRAAVYGLMKAGADVTIVNRTYEKAQKAAEDFGCSACKIEELGDFLKTADIFVSAVTGNVDIVKEDWLKAETVVMDANYKDSLLNPKAKRKGCVVIKGEEWLLNQAVGSYRHFIGGEPPEDLMRKALSESPSTKKDNISLIGFMGSGKSNVGELLSSKTGFDFWDTDEFIQEKEAVKIYNIFKTKGEPYFRKVERETIQKIGEKKRTIIACGGGAVIDSDNRSIIRDNSIVVWLYSSAETAVAREKGRTRPLLDCNNPVGAAKSLLNERLAFYAETSDIIINSEQNAAEEVAEKVYEEIYSAFPDFWKS